MTNNLISNVMASAAPVEPEVGMGATILMWTDRHAATVVEVKRFASGAREGQVSQIEIREDKAVRTDSHGMSDDQRYTFEPDPHGRKWTCRVTKDGTFRTTSGDQVKVGIRSHYFDYSF